MLRDKCGMIPKVQPKAASIDLYRPAVRPVDIVYIAPVPGKSIISKEVEINEIMNPPGCLNFMVQ